MASLYSGALEGRCSLAKARNIASSRVLRPAKALPSTARHERSNGAHVERSCVASLRKHRPATALKSAAAPGATETEAVPIVKIDNLSDPFATVVSVKFGDRLGELLDTITSLKNLGLNIRRAKLDTQNRNTFCITDAETSEKITKSARLEEIRMTIINNMMSYHPDSKESFAAGQPAGNDRDPTAPLGLKRRAVVPTTIKVSEHVTGSCSVLDITTRDRPGLLVNIVGVLKDLNVNVVSAEVDTIGTEAKDEFFVTYHGEPLTSPMVQLCTNALQYYLSLGEVEKEESY